MTTKKERSKRRRLTQRDLKLLMDTEKFFRKEVEKGSKSGTEPGALEISQEAYTQLRNTPQIIRQRQRPMEEEAAGKGKLGAVPPLRKRAKKRP